MIPVPIEVTNPEIGLSPPEMFQFSDLIAKENMQ